MRYIEYSTYSSCISYALLGASGCGKTTLLRCCLGYLRQNSGTITVMGKYPGSRGTEIPGRDLGYMPQVSNYLTFVLYGQMDRERRYHI